MPEITVKMISVAQRLHYIDWFYEQRPVPSDWTELSQSQRNKYTNYALQVLKIWEQEEVLHA